MYSGYPVNNNDYKIKITLYENSTLTLKLKSVAAIDKYGTLCKCSFYSLASFIALIPR